MEIKQRMHSCYPTTGAMKFQKPIFILVRNILSFVLQIHLYVFKTLLNCLKYMFLTNYNQLELFKYAMKCLNVVDSATLLGKGAFGCVYRGKLSGFENDVAFKMTQSNCTATTLKSLLSEIKIMIHVGKHPNVVSIIGAYTGELKRGAEDF
jgi:hypothetical protein